MQFSNPFGSCAEYMSIPEAQLAVMPSNISFEEAAGLPLVCLTAWQAMEGLSLQPGQRIMIHAGAGGVGSVAIQIAKHHFGCHVTTTCSSRNLDFVKSLGADVAIDYNSTKFWEVCQPKSFDCIVDLIGGEQCAGIGRHICQSGLPYTNCPLRALSHAYVCIYIYHKYTHVPPCSGL